LLIKKAQRNLIDEYIGLKYASLFGIAVFGLTMRKEQ
jgi:hypothetical protein